MRTSNVADQPNANPFLRYNRPMPSTSPSPPGIEDTSPPPAPLLGPWRRIYISAALPEIGLDVQALWADVDLELPPPAAAH